MQAQILIISPEVLQQVQRMDIREISLMKFFHLCFPKASCLLSGWMRRISLVLAKNQSYHQSYLLLHILMVKAGPGLETF